MKKEEYKEAEEFWVKREVEEKRMDRDKLKESVGEFLSKHDTCALATGTGAYVRCTPIEYQYWDGAVWFITEGGRKFHSLAENKNVCIAVYDNYSGFTNLHGMQITGTAEFVEPFSKEYNEAFAHKGIPETAIRKLDHTMYVMKVTPDRIDFLNSEFKKAGFDARQYIEFCNK